MRHLELGFKDLQDTSPTVDLNSIRPVLMQAAERMRENYPYQHPLYAGQMLKPPHPIARLAYSMAQFINPNNHALDGGRASSFMEREAVTELASLFGWKTHLGHLCSGGTMANMEALWVAGNLKPGKHIVASEHAHYTHGRISELLKVPYLSIATDKYGRMSIAALKEVLEGGEVGTIVATIGTTGVGTIDPLPQILELANQFDCRVHVDAAYGGYFKLADNLTTAARGVFNMIKQSDSIVIDPHKHGLQPYGCGCIIFRDPKVGVFYNHESPYTYFTSPNLHLGEFSLECSRAGAAAVALWATMKHLPLTRGGEFARDLSKCREAALKLYQWLEADKLFRTVFPPELDIVIWAPAEKTASKISKHAQQVFEKAADKGLHLALVDLPERLLKPNWPDVQFDQITVTCLRSCLMKPEHINWIEKIWQILKTSSNSTKYVR